VFNRVTNPIGVTLFELQTTNDSKSTQNITIQDSIFIEISCDLLGVYPTGFNRSNILFNRISLKNSNGVIMSLLPTDIAGNVTFSNFDVSNLTMSYDSWLIFAKSVSTFEISNFTIDESDLVLGFFYSVCFFHSLSFLHINRYLNNQLYNLVSIDAYPGAMADQYVDSRSIRCNK
jgi:hypothetical protein